MPLKLPNRLHLLFAFIAAGLAACAAGRERPTTVAVTHAVRQDLTSWISSNGKAEPLEPYAVQSQLTTFITNLSVRQGDLVKRGQTLMTMDARDLETELSRARGELFAAEDERKQAAAGGAPQEMAQLDSDLAKTENEIVRLRREAEALARLYARQAATRQEIEQNKSALERAEADKRLIEQKRNSILERAKVQSERASLKADEARHAVRLLEEKIASSRVTAPATGTVYSLSARSGTYVHTGDALAELADLSRIRVRAFVDEPELGLLHQGQFVEITWEGMPNRMWTGEVEQLPKTIVARGSRNVGEVLCSVDNKDSQLLPNTNVDVRIRTAVRENALTLPRSAVRAESNQHYVWVVQAGRLERRRITVGISNSTHYEILNGITETDSIALPGASELREGMPVAVS
jgi:HlyD family secretion protein